VGFAKSLISLQFCPFPYLLYPTTHLKREIEKRRIGGWEIMEIMEGDARASQRVGAETWGLMGFWVKPKNSSLESST
jgi:hypothetical protein